MIRVGPSAIAPISAARWVTDLSGGGRNSPRRGPAGLESRHSARETSWPEIADQALGALRLIVAGDVEGDRPGGHVGRRVERHVLDVDARATELQRDLGDDPRAVRDPHPQLVERAAGDLGLDQLPAALSGLLMPRRDGIRLTGADQLGGLGEARDRRIDLRRDGLAVPGEDVAPDRRVRPGDPRGVAEAGTDLRQVLGLLAERRRRLRHQDVGDHVREVADRRHQPVVRLGLDRLRPRPDVRDRTLHAVVEHASGARGRRQVPAGSLEQVGVRVLHPGGLRSREGMPADEAAVGADGGDHVALHRADVGDRAILARRRRAPRPRGPAAPAPGPRRRPAPRPRPRRQPSHAPSRSPRARWRGRAGRGRDRSPATSASSLARAASPIDPPIRPTPRTAIFIAR